MQVVVDVGEVAFELSSLSDVAEGIVFFLDLVDCLLNFADELRQSHGWLASELETAIQLADTEEVVAAVEIRACTASAEAAERVVEYSLCGACDVAEILVGGNKAADVVDEDTGGDVELYIVLLCGAGLDCLEELLGVCAGLFETAAVIKELDELCVFLVVVDETCIRHSHGPFFRIGWMAYRLA